MLYPKSYHIHPQLWDNPASGLTAYSGFPVGLHPMENFRVSMGQAVAVPHFICPIRTWRKDGAAWVRLCCALGALASLLCAFQWEAWECGLGAWQKLTLLLPSPTLMVKSSSRCKAVMKVTFKAGLKSHFFCPLII